MGEGEPRIGIVGSGIAGMRAANAILKCDAGARIVMFGDEPHRTYNRPGLTKKRYPSATAPGRTIAEDLRVNGADNNALTWRLDTRVENADLRDRVLHLSTGDTFAYDRLVIASGVRPRTSVAGGRECAFHTHRTLRGLDDAQHIHKELQAGEKVTIAGAGFVACELASLAREYGCEVLMLEALRNGPFESILGERISGSVREWVVRNGIAFLAGDSAKELLCGSGSPSDRSLYIEAIGSVPNVEWLHGNGLDLSDGVRVDEYMRVPEWENVFAAGDVARYPDPWAAGRLTRMEFWKNAIDTGDLAGRSVASSLGHAARTSRIGHFPSMATEVCGLRIQIAGNPRISDSLEILCGDLDRPDQGVLAAFRREDVLVGAVYLDKGARFNSAYIALLRSLRVR